MKTCPACQRAYDNEKSFCVYDGQTLVSSKESDPFVDRLIENKYSIDYKIAEGGTGTVYRATHLQLQSVVAIKIMRQAFTNDAVQIERFRREAYAAMKVRHPNAVAVLDFGITAERLVYVVMELLIGQSLYDRLKVRQQLSIVETNHFMQQICAAVAVAHARGIVHRDLKPENIFLHQEDGQEVIKVLDFGIAKVQDFSLTDEQGGELTGGGAIIGTPFYIAPEQCSGQAVDARADIYSLGVMTYQMLTGQLPFDGPSSILVLLKQLNEKPMPIHQLRPELPQLINAVVMHALEKDPRFRPQSVASFAQELAAATRAVSEQEFQDVFLKATDKELEAALLLTNDNNRLNSGDFNRRNVAQVSLSEDKDDDEPLAATSPVSIPVGAKSNKKRYAMTRSAKLPATKDGQLDQQRAEMVRALAVDRRVHGHLSWFDLATIVFLFTGLKETGLLTLHNTEFPPEQLQDLEQVKPYAWLYLQDGNVTYSRLGVRQGREAFYQLFQMPLEGSFLFRNSGPPSDADTSTPIVEAGNELIKEALSLKTLLNRFSLKFPDLLMGFKRRVDMMNWRDHETEDLAQKIWLMLAQSGVTLSELLARSPCCNAKTYQVLAMLLATRQIVSVRTANLSAELITRSTDVLPDTE